MDCQGFAAATYDLYVLGLLDPEERATIDAHIAERCPVCLPALQRSMNLWFVFASTLQNAEPSADFKARLMQIADLSKRVLTFPAVHGSADRPRALAWLFAGIGVIVAVGLVVIAWDAGRASAALAQHQLTDTVANYSRTLADKEAALQAARNKTLEAQTLLQSAGQGTAMREIDAVRAKLTAAQAEATQYRSQLQRQKADESENADLLGVLGEPGLRFLPLKDVNGSGTAVAYALIIPKSKLLIIGSKLKPPAPNKEYQAWVSSKGDSKPVSAGTLQLQENGDFFFENDDAALTQEVAVVAITEEPQGGSSEPTGVKLLVSSIT